MIVLSLSLKFNLTYKQVSVLFKPRPSSELANRNARPAPSLSRCHFIDREEVSHDRQRSGF